MIGLSRVLDIEICQQTAYLVCLLHVGGNLDVAADANRERLVHESQSVEVGFGKISAEGGLDPFGVK